MSGHSSDDGHNYYTKPDRVSRIPDYDVSHEPAASGAGVPTSAPSPVLQTLPAFAYRQSQEYVPKRPKISTSFDRAGPAAVRAAHPDRLPDDSPDPHDFYSRYRDSFIRQSGSVYESLDAGAASASENDVRGAGSSGIDNSMTTAAMAPGASQRSTPVTARSNGFVVSPLSARWNPPRLDAGSTPSPLTDRTAPGSGARAGGPSAQVPKARQSSLQALVQKFNQTQDEVPPLPRKPASRSASESPGPAHAGAPHSFRSRASPQPSQASSSSSHLSARHRGAEKRQQREQQPYAPSQEAAGSYAAWKRKNDAAARGPPPVKSPKSARRTSAIVANSVATQSMNDLSQSSYAKAPRPLFGEIVGSDAASMDPGFGIPRPRRRRGSDGGLPYANATYGDGPVHVAYDASPSSPSAWYKGVTPSLDGISLDKPIPPKPEGRHLHRRSRSDMASRALNVTTLSSAMGKPITILSPPQEQLSPQTSPTSPRRHSQSRIPRSTRRTSQASDSSVSGPSTRPPSTASHYGNATGNYRGPHGRQRSSIPTSVQPPPPTTPDRASASSTTPRRSPRHRHGTSSPERQPSPRLQAYISEAMPTKSPPLRSSRPRQSVSSATTSASRARTAATTADQQQQPPPHHSSGRTKDRPARRMPDMSAVDFAARRQRIQQGFTKSMIETEQEEARRRASIMQDAAVLRGLEAHAHAPPPPPPPDAGGGPTERTMTVSPPVSTLRGDSRDDTFLTPAEDFSEQQRGLAIDTAQATPAKPSLVISQEDSPTLGNATFVDPTRDRDDSSEGPEPKSAVTAGTAETFFDHSPQEDDKDEGADSDAEHADDTPVVESRDPHDARDTHNERPPTSGSTTRQASRRTHQSYATDRSDMESIHIMLGDPRITDHTQRMDSLTEQIGDMVDALGRGWDGGDGGEEQRTLVEPPEERTPGRRPANDSQASISTDSTFYGPATGGWSPDATTPGAHRGEEALPPPLSGNTLDSESYATIGRVLDSYSDPSLLSPENISEFRERLFSQSPDLARKGGWDPKKVTQLYLQGLRSKVATSAVPKPLTASPSADERVVPSAGSRAPTAAPAAEPRPSGEADVEAERERTKKPEEMQQRGGAPPAPGLAVPGHARHGLNRASLSNPDDWASTSPSMLDWFHRQATEDADVPESGTPVVDTPRGERPMLPDIPRGGLGILDLPGDGPVERRSSPLRRAQKERDGPPSPSPTRKAAPPLPGVVNVRAKSPAKVAHVQVRVDAVGPPPMMEPIRPVTPATAKPKADDTPSTTDARTQATDKTPPASADALAKASNIPSELQKKITRRRHILRELVDTESSFGQDMTVVVDIYKGTSNVILNSTEDVKTLFGNAHDIVAFSMKFLDALKNSAKSVYVLPKSKRWRSKRDSSATTESRDTDDQASIGNSTLDLSDEEKDRLTTVGGAFLDHALEMEKVYTEYLKNHDAANQKLQQLQKTQKVQIWLKECQTYANDLTTAWDLDSLLVKPVQRILKYSLFLKDLLEVTPENHPDFVKVDTAAREMVGVSKRINDAKKRADLIEQVTAPGRGGKERRGKDSADGGSSGSRLAITKRFNLRPDKFKPPLGLVDLYQDRDYNAVSDKFGSHFFQLQVVMRDVEMYVEEVQAWVARFCDVVGAVEAYTDVAQSTYLEVESKWRRFRQSMRELQMTALTDHVADVRRSVIEPMTTLLKLHDGPQRLMEKRKKRVPDFARYKAAKDRGEKADKKAVEQGEQFLAINETLKDELPRLFALTGRLVAACLNNFVHLQLRWQSVWKRKLIQAIDLHEVPRSFESVLEAFAGDFRYPEAQVLSLGICNGSLLADAANLVNLLTPAASFGDDDSLRRPSGPADARTGTYGEEFRPRAQSYELQQAQSNPPSQTGRPRGVSGTSGGNNLSPMIPAPDLGRPTESLGLGPHFAPPPTSAPPPAARARIRASSNASSKSPSTPDMPGAWRTSGASPSHFGAPPPVSGYNGRPSTATGRPYNPAALDPTQRHSGDGRLRAEPAPYVPAQHAYGHQQSYPPQPQHQSSAAAAAAHDQRSSAIFSSAMPMSDSPPGEDGGATPTEQGPPPDFNVLFLAASVYEFNIDRARREAGYPYLTYIAGEIFDVIGEKGELWLAKNQDDPSNQVGWIWNKHFAKLAS